MGFDRDARPEPGPKFELLEPRVLLSGSYPLAFTDAASYEDTFFLTPNGYVELTAPMLEEMVGGGDAVFGGGEYAKVGVSCGVYYARMTDGAANDYKFHVLHAPSNRTKPLPPDVTSLSQLPQMIQDELPGWSAIGQAPIFLGNLEWARYYNLPFTVQLHTIGSHGGDIADQNYDLNIYFESMGKDQCMWDVTDVCDPDDNPATLDPSGASWGNFTFATPTMVDPAIAAEIGYDLQFKSYVERNLRDGIHQVLEICSLPRYQGLLVGFAIDPEIHYPAHDNPALFDHPFVEDYHPAMIYAFGKHLHQRYGDDTPLADTNGDGVTFWGDHSADYTASGGFGHSHATAPATWSDIDPPRYLDVQPNNAFWQSWMNFKATVIDEWIEDMVYWISDEGVPAERIYTHQTTYSQFQHDRSNWSDEQWLDDFSYMEISGGYSGISHYQATNCGEGNFLYQNLMRRDEGFGAPEWNPYIHVPGQTWFSQAEVRTHVRAFWDNRGHVMWAHSWGNKNYRVVDMWTNYWGDSDSGTPVPPGWTTVGFSAPANQHVKKNIRGQYDSYFLSPDNLNLSAAELPFFVADVHASLNGGLNDYEDWGISWITNADQTWDSAKTEIIADGMRGGFGTKKFVLPLHDNPNWTGTIKQIRFYPVADFNSQIRVDEIMFAQHSPFTLELQSLMQDKKDTPRPTLYSPTTISTPLALADNLDSMGSNFVVFGTNTDGDFGTAGNFYASAVTCGGVTEAAIMAAAADRLSLTKTGKWRKLILPDPGAEQLLLAFKIGIADGASSVDGVRFRIRLRDGNRQLVTLFDEEYRWNAWSDLKTVDLTAYAGQTVDLYLETHGIGDIAGDASAWGSPVLYVTGGPQEVQFSQAASDGKESTSPANVAVSLSRPADQQVTVNYAVTGGSATGGGDDYTLASGQLVFDIGQTSQVIPITVIDDPAEEPDETIELTLSAPVNATLGANTVHTYTILANDTPVVGVWVDFETPGDEADFAWGGTWAGGGSETLTRASGNDGMVLEAYLGGGQGHGWIEYAPGGATYLVTDATISADMQARTSGSFGSTVGLLMKQFDDDGAGNSGGYVVQLYQWNGPLMLRIGCSSFPSGNPDNWNYLKSGEGHTTYSELALETLVIDKWYNVSAEMSVPSAGVLQIDVTVTDGVNTWNLSYTDSDVNAFTDEGRVGFVYRKISEDEGRFDNFNVIVRVPGDATGDGYVTGADYTIWAANYDPAGPGTATWEMGDFTGDGYVTGADYTIWAANYAPPPPSAPLVMAGAEPQQDEDEDETPIAPALPEPAMAAPVQVEVSVLATPVAPAEPVVTASDPVEPTPAAEPLVRPAVASVTAEPVSETAPRQRLRRQRTARRLRRKARRRRTTTDLAIGAEPLNVLAELAPLALVAEV